MVTGFRIIFPLLSKTCGNTCFLTTSLLPKAKNLHTRLFRRIPVSRFGFDASSRAMSSNHSSLDLSGIFPPIVTPFQCNEQEDIDYGKLEENFNKWNKIPFKGYVVMGSNGEYAYLNPDEKVEMVRMVKQLAPDKLLLAGSGCEATRDTIMMTQRMADAGADAALVVTPCYYKNGMTVDALVQHYTKVADSSPIPVILYSVPANTGIDMPAECAIRLSTHKNIIGVKDSGGDITKIGYMIHKTANNNFQVLAGSASFLLPSLTLGAVGGVCALANVLGSEVCELHQLFCQGQSEKAKLLQHKLIHPNTAVTKTFGVPGLKAAMEMFGYSGGPTRNPLLPLTESQLNQLKQIFSEFDGFQS